MIADDEYDIRNLIKISLEDNGYKVLLAENGKKAWELFSNHHIDLAILDINMPVIDGFSLIRKIREKSTIPVIFLTTRTDEIDKVVGLNLGADDYLSKPFSISELVARVAAQLRRNNEYLRSKDNPKVISYGDLHMNLEKFSVYKGQIPIELGAKEFKLLKLFLENPERVYTKQQLYQEVWDEDYYYDDNTIMVHISRLRSRIEDNPQFPEYLKTIRGIGYKLHFSGKEK